MNDQIGVTITQGPKPWTVLQHKKGFASLELQGNWTPPGDGSIVGKVYVRLVSEDTSAPVLGWIPADTDQNSRTWSLRLKNIPAGGLYRLETSLQMDDKAAMEWFTRGDMVHHLGVGDLWVIAGQSNAAGYGKGPVNDPPELGIHLLRHNGQWDLASHPFGDSTHSIHMENRENANPGHSPFLSFARIVKRETGFPVGLIPLAHGGSPLSKWNPEEDGTLYRLMLRTIQSIGGNVRGILWYQGCTDCTPKESPTYLNRFRRMVHSIRKDLNHDTLPMLTVQLNRHTSSNPEPESDISWGTLREHQRKAAHEIAHVTVIPALDCPLSDEIHNSPAGNLLIGERMARAALATVYGKPVHYQAPEIQSARQLPGDGPAVIELTFDHVKGHFLTTGPLEPVFTIEDDQGTIQAAKCSLAGSHIIWLHLPRRIAGRAVVHGAYEQNPAAHLPLDQASYLPMLAFYQFPIE
ncbi:hypothetical protein GRF59_09680 [Paenibacillus sp. HJL G12]|uniref:Sialate O-acetylesterase domain-containing protein n=1 Tax=Paenibacillus dendrobii TaxID=2691084 RepID=A0A7X3IH87_9BACL|nr:sialate O-acetylesterase [Paenibacillus dendrobii]MWV43904.1 hypothetical protein [Paenibacillus dendrobii]